MKKASLPARLWDKFINALGLTMYYIPVESFKQQFEGIDSTKLIRVTTQMRTSIYTYMANPLKTIYCFDKEGNKKEFKNAPSLQIRFTTKNNKRKSAFFDTVYVENGKVFLFPSRLFPTLKRTIDIEDIVKVEIQNAKKAFKYIG